MSLNVVSLFSRAARPRSWSNQELAEFYRVQGSLARAGLAVETEQGFSDEGDPWFVFCRAESGDVIIHFARIDGLYVVASPAFGSCVRGTDFRALIEGLMEQHPVVMPREKEKGKFFIHPAALLVALVTTAFFKLYQGDALAAEGRDDHHGPHLAGPNGNRAAAASQSHALTLDERSAATLMVAVAVAVAWEQVTNSDAHTPATPIVAADHLPELPTSSVPVAPMVHASLQDTRSADARTEGALDRGPEIVHDSPVTAATPAPTPPQAAVESLAASVKPTEEQQRISTPDTPSVMGSADAGMPAPTTHHSADIAADRSSQPQAAPEQHAAAESSGSTANTSAAMVEVRSVIGDLLQTHLTTGAEAPQQQFVLSLISANLTFSYDAGVPVITIDHGKTHIDAADAGSPGLPTPTFSATTTTTQAMSVVDLAIHEFIHEHADFQIIKLDHEVIMYDLSLTPANARFAEQESFTFSDGSSLLLIGLPHHGAGAYDYGV